MIFHLITLYLYIITIISDQQDYNQYNPFIPIVLIGWINSNHYELLFPIKVDTEIPIELQISRNQNCIPKSENINSNIDNKLDVLKKNKIELEWEDINNNEKSEKYRYELSYYL